MQGNNLPSKKSLCREQLHNLLEWEGIMSWRKLLVTVDEIQSNRVKDLNIELGFLAVRHGVTKDFHVYASPQTEKGIWLYFSPATAPYTQHIMGAHYWKNCDKPTDEEIERVFFEVPQDKS